MFAKLMKALDRAALTYFLASPSCRCWRSRPPAPSARVLDLMRSAK
jgi:hypothetical protein